MGIRSLAFRSMQQVAGRFGYSIQARDAEVFPPDFSAQEIELFRSVQPYTLTSPERIIALRDAVRYVSRSGISGSIVECGVWRGGSMLTVVKTLLAERDTTRDLYLYDTYTHMPPPGDEDTVLSGRPVAEFYDEALASDAFTNFSVERVRELMLATGYPSDRIHLIAGMVEETIPGDAPSEIALCRLDTDFYASTRHEMEHLVPRIVEDGVLIVDDYGHFMGSKKAVDEFFEERGISPLLERIDWTGRMVVVTSRFREALAAARDR